MSPTVFPGSLLWLGLFGFLLNKGTGYVLEWFEVVGAQKKAQQT